MNRFSVGPLSMNQYLLNEVDDLIMGGEFSTVSDIMATALTEFFAHRHFGSCGEMYSIMEAYLQTEGSRAVIKLVCVEDNEKEFKCMSSKKIIIE